MKTIEKLSKILCLSFCCKLPCLLNSISAANARNDNFINCDKN